MTHARSHQHPAASAARGRASAPTVVDRRPQALAQGAASDLANDSARMRRLASVQSLANGGVAQLTGDSTTPYTTHKEAGSPDSKWDGSSDKKDKVWEKMDRDGYQSDTRDFLGATGEAAVPTTNHILAKALLPQFEFDPANLRFGPNGTLRVDDPDQDPDYGIGHDGALTPRSRAIATAFETGTKADLKSTMAAQPIRPHEPTDFDQWYIGRDQWDRIAADWPERVTFWDAHKVTYFTTDYTRATTRGHTGGATTEGVPWAATQAITAAAGRGRFKDLTKFIARGSQIRNPEQIGIATLFQTLRGRAAQVETLVGELGLGAGLDAEARLTQADVDTAQARLGTSAEQSLAALLAELGAFSIKIPEPDAALAALLGSLRARGLDAVRHAWTASIASRLSGCRQALLKSLGTCYRASLATQERDWLGAFRTGSVARAAPYDLAEAARAPHVLATATTALRDALAPDAGRVHAAAPALTSAQEGAALTSFEARLEAAANTFREQIAARATMATAASIKTDVIIATLKGYGIEVTKKSSKQKPIARRSDFLADADLWLRDGVLWINQFGTKAVPKTANGNLHTLLVNLRRDAQSA